MAKKYWKGTAENTTQVSSTTVNGYDGASTYNITIRGVTVGVLGTVGEDTTAAALVAALQAETDDNFTAITWTNPTTNIIKGTANTPGEPFTMVESVTGGTGTMSAVVDDTPGTGQAVWDLAENWSDGSVPVNGDDVVFSGNSNNVCFGLDQSSVTLDSLTIDQSYTGKIGLDDASLVTSADGETVDSTQYEYRETYLKIGATSCDIGTSSTSNSYSGSGRIKINNVKSGSSTTTVHNSASVGTETGKPPVRLLASSTSADLIVRDGSVGVCQSIATETATFGDISMIERTAKLSIGIGTTYTNYEQYNGTANIQANAVTLTSLTLHAGKLTSESKFNITTATINGGTFNCNHVNGASACMGTVNLNDGEINALQSSEARTWTTLNIDHGILSADDDVLTITNFSQPTGVRTLTVS